MTSKQSDAVWGAILAVGIGWMLGLYLSTTRIQKLEIQTKDLQYQINTLRANQLFPQEPLRSGPPPTGGGGGAGRHNPNVF